MDIVLIVIGILFLIIGILGCVLPILPGPPISWVALLLLHFTSNHEFTTRFLIIWAVIAVLATIVDNIIPILGTKKYGGGKKAIWGSTIGLVIGLFLFPPFGIIIGPFLGAVIGELIDGKETMTAIKSGFGAFVGFLGGIILKLIAAGMITFYYFQELF